VYLGGETPFGPTYVGFGYSTSGVSNLFLFVGTP
jgi:NTE family protein